MKRLEKSSHEVVKVSIRNSEIGMERKGAIRDVEDSIPASRISSE